VGGLGVGGGGGVRSAACCRAVREAVAGRERGQSTNGS
jgi:hypothetical protein